MKRAGFLFLTLCLIAFIAADRWKRPAPKDKNSGLAHEIPVGGAADQDYAAWRGKEIVNVTSSKPSAELASSNTNLIEVEMFSSGIRKVKMNREGYQRESQLREANLRETIDKDMAAGLNAEVRSKQEKFQLLVIGLREGTALDEVTRLLGAPDRVNVVITEPHMQGLEYANSLDQAPTNAALCISYWPRVGVPFDGRNGQGYQILYVQFDAQRKLQKWLWQQPKPFISGSFGMTARQEKFWTGAYDFGPPPPEEAVSF